MAQVLYFMGPQQVAVAHEALPSPAFGQVLVQSIVPAISPGTELLIYRGQAPTDLPKNETIPALAGNFAFPLRYGYAVVGRVRETGPGGGAGLGRQAGFCLPAPRQPFPGHP